MMNPKTIRRTCQCCDRAILANTGVIAHHGYQRPQGWQQQVGTCMGARFAPFEASRDRLGYFIGLIERDLETHVRHAAEIEAEVGPLPFHYIRYFKRRERDDVLPRYVETDRADFDDVREAYKVEMLQVGIYRFDDLKKRRSGEIANRIKVTTGQLVEQRARFAAWRPIERWNGERWEAAELERVPA